jgi:DNA polymerase-1
MSDTAPVGSLYLLDAHGLIFQMFHAIGGMSAPDGRPTNAVFGVTRALMSLYDRGADYLIACLDSPEPTFRVKLDTNYKAHREPAPDDLILQEPMIRQIMEAMRIPFLIAPSGFEADDVMATVAKEGEARGLEVFVCSSDKDLRQVLTDRITILNLRKNEPFNAASLQEAWCVRPEQVIDFQALIGDSVDNVPGVPGVGPKTAAKWLQQYGTLDNIIAHADEVAAGPKVKASLKEAIANGKLALSKQLVTLDTRVPLELDWLGWKRRDWDGQRLLELFQEFGFRGYAERVRNTLRASGSKRNAENLEEAGLASGGRQPPVAEQSLRGFAKQQGAHAPRSPRRKSVAPSLFDSIYENESAAPEPAAAEPPLAEWNVDYRLVDTAEAFETFLRELKKQKRITFDLETTHLDALRADIVGYAFAWQHAVAYYLPVRGPKEDRTLDPDAVLKALKPVFEDPAIAKVNQNIKYDLLALAAVGVKLANVAGDPMIAHYLLHAGERTHNLDELTRAYLRHENIPITDLIGRGRKQISMAEVRTAKVCDYSGEDADTALRLADILEPGLDNEGLRKLYDEVELPLVNVLADLEFTGIRIDVPFLQKLGKEMEGQLAEIEQRIHAAAGKDFNISSPVQLRKILFDEMKLPVQKRTGTTGDASTDQETLERLAAMGHELPKMIIEHRQVAKLKGTYVDALPALVNPRTGRVHTSFNQTVAATGRLSSSDPNLQNIPARTEQGRQIRQAFIPREDWLLLTADYSQVELRLLAHLSGDEMLCQAFAEDRDIHASVAAQIFKVPEADVTSAQRRVAKTVNFGVIYGMSGPGLAIRLGISKNEANQFIDAYFARYPRVLEYQQNLLTKCRETGYVSTLLGRRRRFEVSAIRPWSSYQRRNVAEREAINMEIQGSAADLMKLAMLGAQRRLREDKFEAKMLLTVHDELVFEAPPGELSAVADIAREEMTTAMKLDVPLKVDLGAGKNWLDVEDISV